MDAQLHLLQSAGPEAGRRDTSDPGPAAFEASARWHLDDHTRDIGRQGVARAREALAVARRHHLEDAA
jgi:hypothetical protein